MPVRVMRTTSLAIVLMALLKLSAAAQAANRDMFHTRPEPVAASATATQQNSISRFEIFAAPSYLDTPRLNLVQRGVNADLAINLKRWMSVGVDYSDLSGHSDVVPQELTPQLQTLLAASVPPGLRVAVPYKSSAQTFGAGPQFNFRHWQRTTLFVRPAGGLLHESITLNPNSPLTAALVSHIVPSRQKSDTTIFYGVGGGADLNASKHVGVRIAADFGHYKLFNDLLGKGQNCVRISLAPIFKFGGSVQ